MARLLPGVDFGVLWSAIEAAADRAKLGVFVAQLAPAPPQLTYVSEAAAGLLGYTVAELLAGPLWGMLDPDSAARIRTVADDHQADGTREHDLTAIRRDGTKTPVTIGAARFAADGRLYVLGYVRDVSGERNAIAALQQSEERFRFLVERAPDGVVILVEGRIRFINPTAIRLLGADPDRVIGTSIVQYLPPADAQRTMQRIGEMFRDGVDIPASEYHVTADPRRIVEIKSMACEWEGQRAVIAFSRDVTERKAMQEKLVAADRFAALGKLAAGVAHEINNPLAYANLGIELVDRRLAKLASAGAISDKDLAEVRTHLREVSHGLGRIAAVTGDLRTFARGGDDTPPGAVDLVAVVEQSLRMVDNELRHRARLERAFEDVPPVTGIGARLEQVFVNLLINAMQSMTTPETDAIAVSIVARPGDGPVVVTVRDSGHGIPASVIDRVFDPFFTTKPLGEGMGLGLSVCRNIVEEHGGTIEVTSSTVDGPGRGTTVTVTLPRFTRRSAPRLSTPPQFAAVVPPVAPPPPLPPVARVPTPDPDGASAMAVPRTRTGRRAAGPRRRVMIVDDEPFVRETLSVLLGSYHDVIAVDGGPSALAQLEREPCDVVLCDVMMPGMNGAQLFERIATRHPGLERRVIFVTGGAFARDLAAQIEATRARCLGKPFKLDQVLAAIAELA